MFRNLKVKDGFQLLGILSTVILCGYFYVNNDARNKLWQKTYPLWALLANHQMSCNTNAPAWLADILRQRTTYGNALANQIAYIDKSGNVYHCENGYIGKYPWISQPVTENSRFRYASVTKLWTADAILDLVKQQKLALDISLSKVLPVINQPKDPRINDITIDNLLRHQAGFDRLNVSGYDMFGIGEAICPNHLERLNHIKLNYTPSKSTRYSNLGYCLLGEVIGQNQGMPYRDYMNQHYALAKDNIKFIANEKIADEVEYNHTESGLTGIANIYTAFDYTELSSTAGLSGNAVNLAKQIRNMINKPAPNIMSFPKDMKCDNGNQLKDACYGYAMKIYKSPTASLYYKDGDLLGLSSLVVITDDKQVVSILSAGRGDSLQNKQKVLDMIARYS